MNAYHYASINESIEDDRHQLHMLENVHQVSRNPLYQRPTPKLCLTSHSDGDPYIAELFSSSNQSSIPPSFVSESSEKSVLFDPGLLSFSPLREDSSCLPRSPHTRPPICSEETFWQYPHDLCYSVTPRSNPYAKENEEFLVSNEIPNPIYSMYLPDDGTSTLERIITEAQNHERESYMVKDENNNDLEIGNNLDIHPLLNASENHSIEATPQSCFKPVQPIVSYLPTQTGEPVQQTIWMDSSQPHLPTSLETKNGNGYSNNETNSRTDVCEDMTFSSSIAAIRQNIINTKSCSASAASSSSGRTYFWQYNSQCKGPKSIRMLQFNCNEFSSPSCQDEPDSTVGIHTRNMDPLNPRTTYELQNDSSVAYATEPMIPKYHAHSANSLPDYPLVVFEDPVQRRYDLVHCSKLRRGDGNDVTPNLARLHAMGEELENLTQRLIEHGEVIVNGSNASGNPIGTLMEPGAIGSIKYSSESRLIDQAKREKNKLASKICRLKKKAFHEANKIKYTGLGMEYNELSTIMVSLRQMIQNYLKQPHSYGHSSTHNYMYTQEPYKRMPFEAEAVCTNATSMSEIGRIDSMHTEETSLYREGLHMLESINVTHAASRTDALVEEVLNLFRVGQLNDPLVKGMTAESMHQNELLNDSHPPIPWYQHSVPVSRSFHYPDSTNLLSSFHHNPVITSGDIVLTPVQHSARQQASCYPEDIEYHRDYSY